MSDSSSAAFHSQTGATSESDIDRVTVLAHDLRNYLAPAYAHLTALHRRARDAQREADMRAAARGQLALDHALALIENLLDKARFEHGLLDLRLRPLDLGLLARQAAHIFEADDRPIAVEGAERVVVPADPVRLRQALHNLLANAQAHSPPHAPITLQVNADCRGDSGWARLSVRNTGSPIPPQLLPQVFQRFSTGPTSRGLGLGLYLAHSIVVAHGGTLTATSNSVDGTCFTILLPLEPGTSGVA